MTALIRNTGAVPIPTPTPISAPYWDAAAEGRLVYQRCSGCGHANFGPGVACSACRNGSLEWQTSAGRGALYSWTVVSRAPTPGFAVPYAPAIVALDEGFDMVSAIVDARVQDLHAGMRLVVQFHRIDDGPTLAFFAPESP